MSDLISRKAATTEIHNYFKGLIDKGIHNVDVVDCSAEISKRIYGIQAAYDVDWVIQNLHDVRDELLHSTDFESNIINWCLDWFDNAIEIVKGGGQECQKVKL